MLTLSWKIAPAFVTGNKIILKPSEFTLLTAPRIRALFQEAGLPYDVVNIATGYVQTAGEAISAHMKTEKVAFTGSALIGRKVRPNFISRWSLSD